MATANSDPATARVVLVKEWTMWSLYSVPSVILIGVEFVLLGLDWCRRGHETIVHFVHRKHDKGPGIFKFFK